jgi:hypothetical protein
MRQTFDVEYMLEGVNGYKMMRVQAYHPSEACEIVKSMLPSAHILTDWAQFAIINT